MLIMLVSGTLPPPRGSAGAANPCRPVRGIGDVWDVSNRRLVSALTDTVAGRMRVGLNSTGDLLANCSVWNVGMKLWHPVTGKLLMRMPEFLFGSFQFLDHR